jgi:hypothetical protein
MFRIRDPEKNHPGSGYRILRVKKHRIPDLDPQHCKKGTVFTSLLTWVLKQESENPKRKLVKIARYLLDSEIKNACLKGKSREMKGTEYMTQGGKVRGD